jgi:hypothetical protein
VPSWPAYVKTRHQTGARIDGAAVGLLLAFAVVIGLFVLWFYPLAQARHGAIPVWPPISRRLRRSFPTCRREWSRSTTKRRLLSKSEVALSSPRRPPHSLRLAYLLQPKHLLRVAHSLRPSLLPPPQAGISIPSA